MAVVEGTNAGFCTSSPSADPSGSPNTTIDSRIQAQKFTSPADIAVVTETGWYCDNASEEANFEVGIYAHNAGDDEPEELLFSDVVNAKGAGAGWKKVTGLNWSLSPSTIYWLAVQLDNTATATKMDRAESGGRVCTRSGQSQLIDPFGTPSNTQTKLNAIYVVYTTAAGYTHKVNGVAAANMAKVNSVAKADIAKVNQT